MGWGVGAVIEMRRRLKGRRSVDVGIAWIAWIAWIRHSVVGLELNRRNIFYRYSVAGGERRGLTGLQL